VAARKAATPKLQSMQAKTACMPAIRDKMDVHVKKKTRQNPMLCCHDRMRFIDLLKNFAASNRHRSRKFADKNIFISLTGTGSYLTATLMLVCVSFSVFFITLLFHLS